ncbi:Valine--tRNA ligase [Rickettsiales bacterium Ac37b]|nr:Valine--tRNA ligase [Rickettsiales bacterium Ac37b]
MESSSKRLSPRYNIVEMEEKWRSNWEQTSLYKWDEHAAREENFVIDTPPPTVSGMLHMGHVFSYTQTDFIARYMRMIGKNVFYPMGFDDNGLPTERLVEKLKKVRAIDLPRNEFIEICKEIVLEAEKEFHLLFKSLALSVDWSLEYQTISNHSRKISQLSFLDLIQKSRAYRQLQPCLWDPVDRTALAQADLVDKELSSHMNEIYFTTEDGEELIIATTRPELLPACVAVFYHPEDMRYKHLQGKHAVTPLFEMKVPIIADNKVIPEKGTGLVMCCTFGDISDIEWWKIYKLPERVIIDHSGRLTNLDNIKFADRLIGLTIKEARKVMVELLQEYGKFKTQIEIVHSVKCAERSGMPIEILLTPQWFIKILDIKEKLLERSGECNWYPGYMKTRLDNWIKGLNWDWCISRGRYFGVPFPVWYSKRVGEEGKVIVADSESLPVDPLIDLPKGYARDEVEAEQDVMDTWVTSALSPQLNSYAINDEFAIDLTRHSKLFPADLRPQAHEIIRSWAFYTIVKAELHAETVPWKNLMISGWCLAADKTKMSKSKGNIVTPAKLIVEQGVDVIRYWASTSKLGADTAYSDDIFAIGKKLINKIWNASNFVSLHIHDLDKCNKELITETIDLWIISRLYKTIERASLEFNKFEYSDARAAIEEFFWKDFCDNYLELVKVRAYNKDISAINSLYLCLSTILKLFAPFLPHVTEEIYNNLFQETSIHIRGSWPQLAEYIYNEEAEQIGIACIGILNVVRKVKAEQNLSLKATIEQLNITINNHNTIKLIAVLDDLKNVTNAKEVNILSEITDHCIITEDALYKVQILNE